MADTTILLTHCATLKAEAHKHEKFLRETEYLSLKVIQDKLKCMRELIADHNYLIHMESTINPKQVLKIDNRLIVT